MTPVHVRHFQMGCAPVANCAALFLMEGRERVFGHNFKFVST